MRAALADGLERIRPAHPAAVAVDLILAEPGQADDKLEAAFANTPNLVLSSDMRPDGSGWEDPIPRFRKYAVGVGEVHADLDKYDAVSRDLPLEMADAANDRRWALALADIPRGKGRMGSRNSLRSHRRAPCEFLRTTATDARSEFVTRLSRWAAFRAYRLLEPRRRSVSGFAVRRQGRVRRRHRANGVRDRWMTPYSNGIVMPGIEMHANAYETIARQHVPRGYAAFHCGRR